ncbi:MAG: hypothetical protein AAGG51_21515 [Cyanobacteria bacterium P01_G01_bin.54]
MQQQDWQTQIQDYAEQLKYNRDQVQFLQAELGDCEPDPQDETTVEQMQQQLQDLSQNLKTIRQQQRDLEEWLWDNNTKKSNAKTLQD